MLAHSPALPGSSSGASSGSKAGGLTTANDTERFLWPLVPEGVPALPRTDRSSLRTDRLSPLWVRPHPGECIDLSGLLAAGEEYPERSGLPYLAGSGSPSLSVPPPAQCGNDNALEMPVMRDAGGGIDRLPPPDGDGSWPAGERRHRWSGGMLSVRPVGTSRRRPVLPGRWSRDSPRAALSAAMVGGILSTSVDTCSTWSPRYSYDFCTGFGLMIRFLSQYQIHGRRRSRCIYFLSICLSVSRIPSPQPQVSIMENRVCDFDPTRCFDPMLWGSRTRCFGGLRGIYGTLWQFWGNVGGITL
jgi:hypothetical protein